MNPYANKAVTTPALYPCNFCQKKFDKQRYFEHVICQEKCASVIQKVYDDSRKENVELRKRAGNVSEQTQEYISNQQGQIQALTRTIERNNEHIKRLQQEVSACQAEKTRFSERHSEFMNREAQNLKEIEQLKMKHYEELQLNLSQHERERLSIQTSSQQRIEKEAAQHQIERAHLEQEIKNIQETLRTKLKQQMKEQEEHYTNEYNQLKTKYTQDISELKTQMKEQLKIQSDENSKLKDELQTRCEQLNASRTKISDLVTRIHEQDIAIIERKKEHQNQIEQINQDYSTKINQLHSKLKLSNQIHSQDIEAMKQLQLKHEANQVEWESERKVYHLKIRQCNIKHNGTVDAYAELNEKLDQILSFYRQVIAEEKTSLN